jgi:hypothetical protein
MSGGGGAGVWAVIIPAVLSSGILVQLGNSFARTWGRMRAEAKGRETAVQREQARTERVKLVLQRTRYLAIEAGVPLSELPALDDEAEVHALSDNDSDSPQ